MEQQTERTTTELGDFLASIRKEKRLTQIEFAKLLGTNRASIASYEMGASIPSPRIAARFAEALSLPITQLVQLALQGLLDRDCLPLEINVYERV